MRATTTITRGPVRTQRGARCRTTPRHRNSHKQWTSPRGTHTSYLARASGINYSTTVLPDAPLGYWRLGETSGTTAADSSGNSYTGTYVGNPTKNGSLLVDHDSDKSVVFDSVDDAVTLPALPIANTSFTVEAWIRTNTSSPPADQTIFGAFGSTSAGEALAVRLLSDGTLRLSYGGADLDTPAGTVPFSSASRHVVVTYDAATDTSRIYFDGVLRATGNQGPFISMTATANIAYNGDTTTPSRYKGHIDEAAVYGRALSADEVGGHFQSGKSTTTYNYDGDDKRYRATFDSVQTNYTWDPNNPYPQLLAERAGSTLVRHYTYDDEPLSVTNAAAAKSWYHQDKLGSTLAVTSSSGVLQQAFDYEPYGATRRNLDDATTGNPMRYTGQYLDPTGLYHLRARQYDPVIGVFLAADPLGRSRFDPAPSRYAYADGQPSVLLDPPGTSPLLSDHAREILAKTTTGFNGGAFVGFAACDGPPCNAGQAVSGVATGYSGVLAVDSCLYRGDPALCVQDLVRFGSNVVATVVANRFPLVGQYLNLAWAGYGFVAGFVDARAAYAAGIEKFRTTNSPALVGVTLK